MKKCFKCGIEKDISEFYRHPMMADGHLGKCKECTKKDMKERSVLRSDYVRAYDSKRSKSQNRKQYSAIHTKKWREKYPERYKAHCAVNNAVRDGRLKKPLQCEVCGNGGIIHAHHTDYSKPFEVVWMCARCHAQIQ